jgi:hypothetical protein
VADATAIELLLILPHVFKFVAELHLFVDFLHVAADGFLRVKAAASCSQTLLLIPLSEGCDRRSCPM